MSTTPYKKNLRTIKVKITAQTQWHLQELAAQAGYGEKDLGRVIDKLVRAHCAQRKYGQETRK